MACELVFCHLQNIVGLGMDKEAKAVGLAQFHQAHGLAS